MSTRRLPARVLARSMTTAFLHVDPGHLQPAVELVHPQLRLAGPVSPERLDACEGLGRYVPSLVCPHPEPLEDAQIALVRRGGQGATGPLPEPAGVAQVQLGRYARSVRCRRPGLRRRIREPRDHEPPIDP